MKTLLLCGYRNPIDGEIALGVSADQPEVSLIDRRIVQLRDMGFEVVCVIGGPSADAQLKHCPRIAESELVFDTNEPLSLLSNTRAGAFAAPGEACFALPVEVDPPSTELWRFLLNEHGKAGFGTPHAFLQAVEPTEGAPWQLGLPLLITRNGVKTLQTTPDLKSLLDARLQYLHLPFQVDADLAPSAIPL